MTTVEKEKIDLETDIDYYQTSSLSTNNSNTIENIKGLPTTVSTVATVTDSKDNDGSSNSSSSHIGDNNRLNSNIGKKGLLYYCKEHPKFENRHPEEIENHLLYSKDHAQENPDIP
ncbi:MAG TPA: hypothetical protein VFI70_04570, partial [Nitrososphaeraceae archaeon]|nr:hypothetical protein [Nitrososphaeraceae archaeon]